MRFEAVASGGAECAATPKRASANFVCECTNRPYVIAFWKSGSGTYRFAKSWLAFECMGRVAGN